MSAPARTGAWLLGLTSLAAVALGVWVATRGEDPPPAPPAESERHLPRVDVLEVHLRLGPGVTWIRLEDDEGRPLRAVEDLRFDVWIDGSTAHPGQVTRAVALGADAESWRVETVPHAPLGWYSLSVPLAASGRLRLRHPGLNGLVMYWPRGSDVVHATHLVGRVRAGDADVRVRLPGPMH